MDYSYRNAVPILLPDFRLSAPPLKDGARLAVTFQAALEGWLDVPDYAVASEREYGYRTGAHRLLTVLRKHGIQGDWAVSGLVAEHQPDLVRRVVDDGHDILGHGYAQDRPQSELGEQEDLEVIRQCAALIESASGLRPTGWGSQGCRRGNFTVENLLREGFTFTEDFRECDVPYVVARRGDACLLAVPRYDQLTDAFAFRQFGNWPEAFFDYFKRTFDRLYLEGSRGRPTMFSAGYHCTIARAWLIPVIDRCIEYARRHEGVWICTERELTDYYLGLLRQGGMQAVTAGHGKALTESGA